MAEHPVYIAVPFTDSAERTSVIRYRLERMYNDAVPNLPALITDMNDLIGELALLTWAHIGAATMELQIGTPGAAANVAANNQIRAFSRTVDEDGIKTSFEVPAWDDLVYDQDSNHLLSAAYNVIADNVRGYLANPETGASMSSLSWSQSRTRKSHTKIT